jgi:hypothetical protein
MIEELNKIGDINSIGDLFDFKLSIKTIILLLIVWGMFAFAFVIFIFGGVNNTIDYATNVIEATKQYIVINKDKKTNTKNEHTKNEGIRSESIRNENKYED